jgi:hypothetical protein
MTYADGAGELTAKLLKLGVTAVEPHNRDRKKDETIRVSGYVRSRFVKEFTCP